MSVYILSGARTPQGAMLGQLSQVPAAQLAAVTIKENLKKTQLDINKIDEVILGSVLTAGQGQAPARQALRASGLPDSIPCTTINKVCGSGMKSIMFAAGLIKAGDASVVLAGGMENMSLAPYLLPGAREGFRFGAKEIKDAMQFDGLWDPYQNTTMGALAELCVSKYGMSKDELDAFAVMSINRAKKAQADGVFKSEIVPVEIKDKKGSIIVSEDEGISKALPEKIAGLRPVFTKEGLQTAGTSSSINDGAATLILAGDEYKDQAEFKITAYAQHAEHPDYFTLAPIGAIKKVLEKAHLKLEQVDLFEINEAFACVTLAAVKELSLPIEKVNIYGGAIVLGHPIGASGARILVTLMNGLKRENKKIGLATLCIGGGEAVAMIIERIR